MAELLQDRVARAQARMLEAGIDLMVLSLSSNLRYLTGFSDEPGERLLVLLVPAKGKPIFLVPELYEAQVRGASEIEDLRVWKDGAGPQVLLTRTLADLCPRKASVALDDSMWATFVLELEHALPSAAFSTASAILVPLRMQKSPPEISAMEEAGAIADRAFEELVTRKISGKSELEVARALEESMREHGADGIAFETLVASGPNSALPHHRAGQRKVQAGDVVILDYGCRVHSYPSDVSRTVVCQRVPDGLEEIRRLVDEAQTQAMRTVKPGVTAEEVDRGARSIIARAGHAERFIHRTGHGIGLDVHEPPYIVEGNRDALEAGMSFSIEPGIYFSGRWGVRIEDVVVVEETGARPMTRSTHALQVVG